MSEVITFFPGPSQIFDEIELFLSDAFKSGMLSQSHRSTAFTDMCKNTVSLLRNRLQIPDDYGVYFTSSATENWETISECFVISKSFHMYSGSFGERWYQLAKYIKPQTEGVKFNPEKSPEQVIAEAIDLIQGSDVLCVTHNETSNGTMVRPHHWELLKSYAPDALLAIDTVSSLGGVMVPFNQADIIYASVQKCFGMPAGLGLLICSPKAIERAKQIGAVGRYNSFLKIHENMLNFQTPYTPNVLGIYLLGRVLEQVLDPKTAEPILLERKKQILNSLSISANFEPLIADGDLSSDTVITVSGSAENIAKIKKEALEMGIRLGNGYGQWKETTFRIANFPAIPEWAIVRLCLLIEQN